MSEEQTASNDTHDCDGDETRTETCETGSRGKSDGLDLADQPGTETGEHAASQNPPLSKNQMKKQKKMERWQQIKAEKRQTEREKKKKRLADMKERGEEIGPSRKSLKKNRMVDSACRQRVVIDCSFDTYMTEKDIQFLVQQIQHSYASNRRADNPLQLHICGISGKAKQRLDNIGDYRGWDIYKEERDFTEVFPKEEIVYLSSESPNVLSSLDDDKVYVIGGLVDHNHHKGLCHRLAEERGLAHAQLPIGQFLQLKSRKVLTINHVFEILLRFTESKNWQTSLLTVLPQRKGVCVKTDPEKNDPDGGQDTHTPPPHSVGDQGLPQRKGVCVKTDPEKNDPDGGQDTHTPPPHSVGDQQAGTDTSNMSPSVQNGSKKLSASGYVKSCVDVSLAQEKASSDGAAEECGSSCVISQGKTSTNARVPDIGKDSSETEDVSV
ncbi:hypothetical protein ACOMHN_041886 [Nucella lapillus]